MSRLSVDFALLVAALVLVGRTASAEGPSKHECVYVNSRAQDLRREGKLREAREKLMMCAVERCPGPVREDCAQRLDEVNAAMPSVVFEAKDGAGGDLSAVRVAIDGQPLTEKLEGAAIEVDPGSHRFVFEAEGLPRTEKALILHEGEKGRRERIVLGAAQAMPTSTGQPATGGRPPPVGAIVAGGVGVAGLVVGSIFGAMALSDASDLKALPGCPSNCPPSAQSQIDTLHGHQWISDIGLGVGIVGLGVGAALFFTSHAPEQPPRASLRLDMGPGVIGLRGGF